MILIASLHLKYPYLDVQICGLEAHLQINQNGSNPHSLADFQVVCGEREAWRALVVGRQNLNVNCSD